MGQKWELTFDELALGGFAPAFWKSTYPVYGNRNQAADMQNVDITNPGFITQGPALTNLTNGDQGGAITTLVRGILDEAAASDVAYAVGGDKLQKISSTAVTNAGSWPHTIDKAAVTGEDGEDVAYYQGNIYYSYNHSGSGGDIGKLIPGGPTFDDDWGSTTPTNGAALQGSYPHPLLAAGNDLLYCGNKNYITSYDGDADTFVEQDLDLPSDYVVYDIEWAENQLFIATNRIDITGSNKNFGSIFKWDGEATSWDVEIKIHGRMGGMFNKAGRIFFFYQDLSEASPGGYRLAVVQGNSYQDLAEYTGSLPSYYQITEYRGFIAWVSSGEIWIWGQGSLGLPIRVGQLADCGYTTAGGFAAPFGTPLVASHDGGSNYRLAYFNNYDTACTWKTLLFDLHGLHQYSMIDRVRVWTEELASGAQLDLVLKDNQGATHWSESMSFSADGAVLFREFTDKIPHVENLRLELDWSNGSSTNPVKLKRVVVNGHFVST